MAETLAVSTGFSVLIYRSNHDQRTALVVSYSKSIPNQPNTARLLKKNQIKVFLCVFFTKSNKKQENCVQRKEKRKQPKIYNM